MADLLGVRGLSFLGRERLIAAFVNGFHIYNSSLDRWDGMTVPISRATKVRSAVFLDKAYFTNGWRVVSAGSYEEGDDMKRYDGIATNLTAWRNETQINKTPLANYILNVGDKLYLANLYYKNIDEPYPSRVWFPDLPIENEITWGFEEGTTATGGNGGNVVRVSDTNNVYFKLRNIKIGDPIYFVGNATRVKYNISSIRDNFTLILTENLESTLTNAEFWAGSNWLDVAPNDGDIITGIGENNDRPLFFKRHSLWRYNQVSLARIKGVPGTTSQDSVVNIKEYTYYFHDTGIWRTDGTTAELISRPVQDYLDGMNVSNYTEVVAWRTGPSKEILRVFIGDIDNNEANLEVTNCFLDFDTALETWSVGRYPYKVTCITEFTESTERNIYLGVTEGNDNRVYQDWQGNDDGGTAIELMADSGYHFPTNELIRPLEEKEITKIQVHTKYGRGMQVKYRLYGTPWKKDLEWRGALGDIENDVTEFLVKGKIEASNIGRGIALQFTHINSERPPQIEKVDIYYKPTTQRSL